MKKVIASIVGSIAATIIMLGFVLFRFADGGGGSPRPDDPPRGVRGGQRL